MFVIKVCCNKGVSSNDVKPRLSTKSKKKNRFLYLLKLLYYLIIQGFHVIGDIKVPEIRNMINLHTKRPTSQSYYVLQERKMIQRFGIVALALVKLFSRQL